MKYTGMDWVVAIATGLAVALVFGLMAVIIGQVLWIGLPVISIDFLTGVPESGGRGGIWFSIYGTVMLTLLMTIAVVPVGVATGIYLSEYAPRRSRLADLIRGAVTNLAGVPSIVFGLFGVGFFVYFIGRGIDDVFYGEDVHVWGRPAVLWSALTLAVLTLPVVIVTTEESLRAVPRDLREAALGLGATRFQSVVSVILPRARGGILTGVILAISRGAGEVAPILFTGAVLYVPQLPFDVRDKFMHLGYHVYALSTQSHNVDAVQPTIFGTVLVLLALTFSLNLTAMIIRARSRPG
ncbi:MAG: phosphate ABC transporter permease PstA [Sandaracinaceae bacterium]